MSFDIIFILGAGAIGSAYGAALSKRNKVVLIGRKTHVEAIRLNGLRILGDLPGTFRLEADTEIRSIPENALIVLTTKANDSAEAMKSVTSLLRKDTVILVLQNGLGNETLVGNIVGDRATVLRGTTTVAAEMIKPGQVKFWKGQTIVENRGKAGKAILETLESSGLAVKASDNIKRHVWIKLTVNCIVNPLTALLHVRDGDIITESLRNVRHGIFEECAQIAEAEGVALPDYLEQRIDKQVAKYENFSSMYQDIARGRKTEIDFLNAKIVELGRKHHIQTPVNETLMSLIRFLEEEHGFPGED